MQHTTHNKKRISNSYISIIMKNKPKKQATHWLKVIVIGITLGFALQFVRAWTEPTSAPPGGNIGAPLNTSGVAQTKAGNLNVNGGMLIGASTAGGNKGAGTINADQVCIRGVCNSTWPSGGSGGGGGGGGGTPAPTNVAIGCDGGRYLCGQTYTTTESGCFWGSGITTYACNCSLIPNCNIDCPFTVISTVPCFPFE